MPGKFKIILKCIGLSIFLSSASVNAQLYQDTTALNLIRENVDYIYNLQFDDARELYTKVIQSYPDHPIRFILRGLMTYWDNYPLLYTSPAHVSFEEDMRQCIRLSESNNNPAYEAEYLLVNLCARAMLLMFYADNGVTMEVIPLIISTYKYLRRSFDFSSSCTDLYYYTGLYNYYRVAYPKAHPIYKSLALLFPKGDIERGLNELQNAAKNSVVLRAESCFILTWIYLFYENSYPDALFYCKALNEKYPENELYTALNIQNLLLMKKYDEAEKMIAESPEEGENSYFQAQLTIFKGILEEIKYNDYKLAEQYYLKGIHDISPYNAYGNEYAAYAYYGLSRINNANGERKASKTYRKEAIKLGDYEKIKFDQ